jgi:hypothetical protein
MSVLAFIVAGIILGLPSGEALVNSSLNPWVPPRSPLTKYFHDADER